MHGEFLSKEIIETRVCKDCGVEKLLKSFTHKRKGRKPLFAKNCFACKSIAARRRKGVKPRMLPFFCLEKKCFVRECKKCNEIKPLTEFPIDYNDRSKNYHQGKCFSCRDSYLKEWFQSNFERIQKRNKSRLAKMSDEEKQNQRLKQKQWTKKWYENGGKEVMLKNSKKPHRVKYFREWNRKKMAAMTPEQKRAFHDKKRESYQKRDRKRRALELSCEIIVPYSKQEIIKRDGSDCYLCGKTLTFDKINLDHVLPITRNGNDKPENIKIACKSCNSSKNNKTLTEFKKWRGDYDRFQKSA